MNMKKSLVFPLTAVVAGAAAFVLRLLQNRTGFEPGTGLPIPGVPAAIALPLLLAALAAALILMVRRLPREEAPGPVFPDDFSTKDPRHLLLPVAGVFLITLSGATDLLMGLGLLERVAEGIVSAADPTGMTVVSVAVTSGFSPRAHLLLGLLSLVSAAGLFLCAAACRRKGRVQPPDTSAWSLAVVVSLVIRLVLTYRIDSVNPALEAYYVELLALVFLTLAFYRLSSFSFRAGQTRRFILYACAAVVLCITVLADDVGPSSSLLYAGGALTLLGFLYLRLREKPVETDERSTDID